MSYKEKFLDHQKDQLFNDVYTDRYISWESYETHTLKYCFKSEDF